MLEHCSNPTGFLSAQAPGQAGRRKTSKSFELSNVGEEDIQMDFLRSLAPSAQNFWDSEISTH